jgi:hypothetical protein
VSGASLWLSVPVLVLEVLCIAGMHWAERNPGLTERQQTRVTTVLAAVAAVGCLVLVVGWWAGW